MKKSFLTSGPGFFNGLSVKPADLAVYSIPARGGNTGTHCAHSLLLMLTPYHCSDLAATVLKRT